MSDYIPEVVIVQILQQLPVKSLLRFRSVCKCWKQLIDSPSFVQNHLSVQKPRFILQCEDPGFLILDPRTLPKLDTLRPPIDNTPKRFHLAGTLHGIVCLYDNQRSLYLWNPSIRKFSVVPLPQLMPFEWRTNPFHVYGAGTYSAFWIDPSTKEFKIVLFKLRFDVEDVRDAAIYSSIDGNWKAKPLRKMRKCKPLQECPAIVIGEVAYWRCYFEVKDEDDDRVVRLDVVVLSFYFGIGRFSIIPAPSLSRHQKLWDHPILCTWEGALSLVYHDLMNDNRVDVYLREEGLFVHMFGFNFTSPIGRVLWLLGESDESGKAPLKEEMQQNSKVLMTFQTHLMLCESGSISSLKESSGFWPPSKIFVACDFVESLLFP